MKRALVTGITGQDGSYLAELLLAKGYEVHGLVRRTSTTNTSRIMHLPQLKLHEGDVTDHTAVVDIMYKALPHEVYHLAAQSHVGTSYTNPHYTTNVIYNGTLNVLEAVRTSILGAKVYNAVTSEMFGNSPPPQHELTPLDPLSPYAIAKTASYHLARQYRAKGMFVANGILFNHESPRRGENFVTRKVTKAVAAIKAAGKGELKLGNLSARRDWGYAPEYVEAMWRMLQHHVASDYVVATGEDHTVEEFVAAAFTHVGLDWRQHVVVDAGEMRPIDVPVLRGDASKIKAELGWTPTTKFAALVGLMVDADVEAASGT